MSNIKLHIGDSQKTFSVPFVKARMLRRAIQLSEEMGDAKKVSLNDVDAMVDFVVDLFNGQFTADELWDGLSTEEFIPEITRCMNEVTGGKKADPNVRTRNK